MFFNKIIQYPMLCSGSDSLLNSNSSFKVSAIRGENQMRMNYSLTFGLFFADCHLKIQPNDN